ncbi:MAG: hypothetical protein HY403_04785 [Elusimicrobia bacterium]|nr:hypothetical protein [Elusimicrobiota bacterium]
MTFDESAQKVLLGLVEKGVSASADKLATTSHTEWRTETVSIRSAPLANLQTVLAGDETQHAGAFFSMPGGMFLVMFTKQSGGALAKAFLPGRAADQAAALEREAVAEISNIVVHSVANIVADACDEVLFVSAPEVVNGRKADLLKIASAKFQGSDGASAIVAYIHLFSVVLFSDCTIILLLNSTWRDRLLKALD